MEEFARSRRSLDQPAYGIVPRTPTLDRATSDAISRFRSQVPPPALSHSRSSSYSYYGDTSPVQVPPTSSSLQFPPSIHEQDRQPAYSQYGSNVVYSMAQQANASTSFDNSHPYVSRGSADAVQVLSSHFAGVPPPFYPAGDAANHSPVASQHTPVSRYDGLSYGQNSIGQIGYSQGYTPTLQELTPVTQGGIHDQAYDRSQSIDEAYADYKQGIRRIFTHIHGGNLIQASQSLLDVSIWLLSNAAELGIVRDEQELHAERLKMWDEFNHCWLAVLQKQKDMTHEVLDSGNGTAHHHGNLIPEEFLEKLGRELVRLCDGMERHGLVDYQMGVWEEQILELLTQCINLLESDDEDDEDGPDEPATAD